MERTSGRDSNDGCLRTSSKVSAKLVGSILVKKVSMTDPGFCLRILVRIGLRRRPLRERSATAKLGSC